MTKAAASVDRQAQEAGTAAFNAVVNRIAGGMSWARATPGIGETER